MSSSVIDSHVHLWDPERIVYPWLQDIPLLNQVHDITSFEEAYRGLDHHDTWSMIFVECTGSMQDDVSKREVRWVSRLAADDSRIAGVVAHASLEHGLEEREHLDWLSRHSIVRGVRRLIQQEADPAFCARQGFVEGVELLAEYGFTFDACIYHEQLPDLIGLVDRCTDVQFVLDHLGKPPIKAGIRQPWKTHISALASLPNVVCKVSGALTEADHERWSEAEVIPYIEHVIAEFGVDRVLFGSDWPVLSLAGTMRDWYRVIRFVAAQLSERDQRKLFCLNAERTYKLNRDKQ
jgi:L-fuconolactonase